MSLYDEMEEHNTLYGGMSCPLESWMERVKRMEFELAWRRYDQFKRGEMSDIEKSVYGITE